MNNLKYLEAKLNIARLNLESIKNSNYVDLMVYKILVKEYEEVLKELILESKKVG
jgi:hypothetical protein